MENLKELILKEYLTNKEIVYKIEGLTEGEKEQIARNRTYKNYPCLDEACGIEPPHYIDCENCRANYELVKEGLLK